MNDDDFSGLVRSGSQHSVTVSEHTGNAKTPKNMVVSHEEETEARKRAFEEKALAALDAEKALAEALAEHTEHVANTDAATRANVQNIAIDALKANQQKIGSDNIGSNVQDVSNGKGIASNVQNVPTDAITANQQKLTADKGLSANRQGVATDVIEANRQGIPTDVFAPNVQEIPVDGMAANLQSLDNGPALAPNLQGLPNEDVATNRQTLGQSGSAKNEQGIPTDALNANKQPVGQGSLGPNQQTLTPAPSHQPNNQAVGADAPSLNRQAAPEDAPLGPNRQGLDNKNIASHFATLPAGALERQTVDFSSSTDTASKPIAKTAANTKPAAKSTMRPGKAPRPSMTVAEQQEAKVKREKMMDEFHGRVAGIKHNVDVLNERLSDFEEKVHKEDAKLIKGDPDDFEIDLG